MGADNADNAVWKLEIGSTLKGTFITNICWSRAAGYIPANGELLQSRVKYTVFFHIWLTCSRNLYFQQKYRIYYEYKKRKGIQTMQQTLKLEKYSWQYRRFKTLLFSVKD